MKELVVFGNNGQWLNYEVSEDALAEIFGSYNMDSSCATIIGRKGKYPWAEVYEKKPGGSLRGYLAMLYLEEDKAVPVGIDDLKHLQAFSETITVQSRKIISSKSRDRKLLN